MYSIPLMEIIRPSACRLEQHSVHQRRRLAKWLPQESLLVNLIRQSVAVVSCRTTANTAGELQSKAKNTSFILLHLHAGTQTQSVFICWLMSYTGVARQLLTAHKFPLHAQYIYFCPRCNWEVWANNMYYNLEIDDYRENVIDRSINRFRTETMAF